mmetsp:Transcript_22598/g.53399  ORF Transcript_22598/g.53399 Transcript_22598/m.53399 type:complete len:208 (-) Transcript_22598:966-1589(-)
MHTRSMCAALSQCPSTYQLTAAWKASHHSRRYAGGNCEKKLLPDLTMSGGQLESSRSKDRTSYVYKSIGTAVSGTLTRSTRRHSRWTLGDRCSRNASDMRIGTLYNLVANSSRSAHCTCGESHARSILCSEPTAPWIAHPAWSPKPILVVYPGIRACTSSLDVRRKSLGQDVVSTMMRMKERSAESPIYFSLRPRASPRCAGICHAT